MSSNIIEIIGLSYKNVFSDFSIAFEKNKFITITGPNNCGKTTLLRIIDGEISTKNTVLINNKRQEEYKITDLGNIIKKVIPTEERFKRIIVEEELLSNMPKNYPHELWSKRIKNLSKKLNITKLLTKTVDSLTEKEKIILYLAAAIIKEPSIIVVDDLNPYFSNTELIEFTKKLKNICLEEKISLIMATINLDVVLESDYTYIINNSEIILEGNPTEILEKDNILNKAGLNLPFMMDLSVKLKDYDLIKKIQLDMEEMVNTLWN